MSSNDEALETEQINKDEKEEILSPSDVEKVFASQGMQVKVIDKAELYLPAGDGRESPKKRTRKDVDEDELTECFGCDKTFNIPTCFYLCGWKGLVVSCVIKEALQFASERGTLPVVPSPVTRLEELGYTTL